MFSKGYKSIVTITVLIWALTFISNAAATVSIVFCQDATQEGEPIAPAEIFPPDVPQILAVVTVEEADAGALVRGIWVSVDAIEIPDYPIDEAEGQFESAGGGTMQFSISKPNNGWPIGNYRLDVTINGQPVNSAPFKIIAEVNQSAPGGSHDASTSEAGLSAEDQEKLQALEAARQAGILSDEEYNRKKAELMQGGTSATTEITSPAPQPNVITPPLLPPAGQFYQTSQGISFWYPAGWTVKEVQDKLELLPANPLSIAGAPTEYYFIKTQTIGGQGPQSLNDPLIQQYVQVQMQTLSALLQPMGSPVPINAASGSGLIYNWESNILKGLGITLVARTYVGYANNRLTTLVGFGPKELVQAREQELNQVFASLGSGTVQGGSLTASVPSVGGPQANTGGPGFSGSSAPAGQADVSGNYTLSADGATLTLVLNQDAQGNVSGALSSTSGAQYQISGQVSEGVAAGICQNNQGSMYFEAELQGSQLFFAFIGIGSSNMPDYNDTRELVFSRAGSSPSTAPTPPTLAGPPVVAPGLPPAPTGALVDLGGGIKLQCPAGWIAQQGDGNVVLRHSTIVGAIVILPHMMSTYQQVQQNMLEGVVDENARLSLVSALQPLSNNAVAGEYSGVVDAQQMKAHGIGTFSPHGGGVFIIAMAPPNQYGQQLIDAARSVAAGMQYSQPQTSNLVQHFAGHWWSYNDGAYQRVYLYPDGRYSDSYEYSVSAENRDQYGDVTSSGTSASHQQSTGRWTVQGDVNRGVLTIIGNDGAQNIYNYRVHIENGQTYYTEYWFEGQHWKKGPPP